MARDFLCIELALNHNLGGNACVIGAWHKDGVAPKHAMVANQPVHDGLIKGVPHVQRARHIGGRKLNRVGRSGRLFGYPRAGLRARGGCCVDLNVLTCGKIASALPFGIPTGFDLGRFEAF